MKIQINNETDENVCVFIMVSCCWVDLSAVLTNTRSLKFNLVRSALSPLLEEASYCSYAQIGTHEHNCDCPKPITKKYSNTFVEECKEFLVKQWCVFFYFHKRQFHIVSTRGQEEDRPCMVVHVHCMTPCLYKIQVTFSRTIFLVQYRMKWKLALAI